MLFVLVVAAAVVDAPCFLILLGCNFYATRFMGVVVVVVLLFFVVCCCC